MGEIVCLLQSDKSKLMLKEYVRKANEMKAWIIARQPIINCNGTIWTRTDDSDLIRMDGIRYGTVHYVDKVTDNEALLEELIQEFEKQNPSFKNAEYELVIE